MLVTETGSFLANGGWRKKGKGGSHLFGLQNFGNIERVHVAASPAEGDLEDMVQLGERVARGDAEEAGDDGVLAVGQADKEQVALRWGNWLMERLASIPVS